MSDPTPPTAVPEDDEEKRRPISLEEWSDSIEETIEEAMRAGKFDNLSGKGKPLNLSKNPYGQETELAHRLLKDNDFTLPWIARRSEMLARVETFRGELEAAWLRHHTEYQVAQSETIRMGLAYSWRQHLNEWRRFIIALNKQIGDVNLTLPQGQKEIFKVDLKWELSRIGASEALP